MTIFSAIADAFRAECPERKKKENLRRAKVLLEEAEVGLEDYQAQVLKLRTRIERLEGVKEVRGTLNKPTPGTVPAPRIGEAMGEWAARLGSDQHATA